MIYLYKCLLALSLFFAHGCSYLASSAMDNFGSNLKQVMLNHNDPELVAESMPTFLMIQEAILLDNPKNQATLLATANLYSSYLSLSGKLNSTRKQHLSQKAFDFSLQAACLQQSTFCTLKEKNFDDFSHLIDQFDKDDLDSLYTLGKNWIHWIQANKSDWNAIAQLAQVKYIMNHVVAIDEQYQQGEPYLYLAVMESLVPPALGGHPDIAKRYFEKALLLSDHKNLMVPVLYAQHYARMMFERELHDTLLNQTLNTSVEQKDLTLSNILAHNLAKKLLQSADDYF